MISALQKGKVILESKEDSLTSSVFDLLLLFPDDIFYKILKKSCYGNELPEKKVEVKSFHFWPHWDATNTSNTNFVEPDLFIRFDCFDLIIEAKRWDDNQQYSQQWENEYRSYMNEYAEDEKDVFLLAIGGINNEQEEIIRIKNLGSLTVIKCRWYRILDELLKLQEELQQCRYISNSNTIRHVELIVSALAFHGYIETRWFDDMYNKLVFSFDSSFSTLNNWRV